MAPSNAPRPDGASTYFVTRSSTSDSVAVRLVLLLLELRGYRRDSESLALHR